MKLLLDDILINDGIYYYSSLNDDEMSDYLYNNPRNFIQSYLEKGDKIPQELAHLFNDDKNNDKFFHTLSIYIMGIILFRNVPKIKNIIVKYLDSYIDCREAYHMKEFLYDWFLTSFFHDFGFSTVSQEILPYEVFQTKDQSIIRDNVLKLIFKIKNEAKAIPNVILDNHNKYDAFRCKYHNSEFIDHGFFSGSYFYNNRVQEYKEIEKKAKDGRPGIVMLEDGVYQDTQRGLIWTKSIIDNIQLNIAATIIGHNVFFIKSTDKDVKIYENFHLNSLIIDRPVFLAEEFPLFFLLVLVDTIDIYKFLKKNIISIPDEDIYKQMFEMVSLRFYRESFIIHFKEKGLDLDDKMYIFLKEQEYWLPIKLKKSKTGITIRII